MTWDTNETFDTFQSCFNSESPRIDVASVLFLKPIQIQYSNGPLVHFLFYDSKVFWPRIASSICLSLCNFFVLLILWPAGRTIYKRVNQRSRRTSCLLASSSAALEVKTLKKSFCLQGAQKKRSGGVVVTSDPRLADNLLLLLLNIQKTLLNFHCVISWTQKIFFKLSFFKIFINGIDLIFWADSSFRREIIMSSFVIVTISIVFDLILYTRELRIVISYKILY